MDKDRFTSLYTLDIRPERKESKITPVLVYRRIFDATKVIDDFAAIIISDTNFITRIKTFHQTKNMKKCSLTSGLTPSLREFIFHMKSTHTVSQLKYGSKYDGTTGIFETLRENLAFIKLQKFNFLTETSIGFSLWINPKLILRNVLKKKIDEICPWLDLDDEGTKALIKPTLDNTKTVLQEIVIPAYDIYHKVFGSGTGNDRITTNVYEIRISPEHTPILISIL